MATIKYLKENNSTWHFYYKQCLSDKPKSAEEKNSDWRSHMCFVRDIRRILYNPYPSKLQVTIYRGLQPEPTIYRNFHETIPATHWFS